MDEFPVLPVPADVYRRWRESGTLLLRVQSDIVGVAEPLEEPIAVGRGRSSVEMSRAYLAWREANDG
jgi:hypothetical protein